MKKLLVIVTLLICCCTFIWPADEAEFKPSTRISLTAYSAILGIEPGLGVDFSVMPHMVGSFGINVPLSAILEEQLILHFDPSAKFYFRKNNTGPYLLTGLFLYAVHIEEIHFEKFAFFIAGFGASITIFNFMGIDLNFSAPVSTLFQYAFDFGYSDYYESLPITAISVASIKISLGMSF